MNIVKVVELLEKYGACIDCGSEIINNGHGSLEITDDQFIRECKCGFVITIEDETEE